jgi:hypothetical protein
MDRRLYEGNLPQDLRELVEKGLMIGAVQMKLLSMELNTAQNVLADAQAASAQPGGAEVQAEVILELSAEAQKLLQLPLY